MPRPRTVFATSWGLSSSMRLAHCFCKRSTHSWRQSSVAGAHERLLRACGLSLESSRRAPCRGIASAPCAWAFAGAQSVLVTCRGASEGPKALPAAVASASQAAGSCTCCWAKRPSHVGHALRPQLPLHGQHLAAQVVGVAQHRGRPRRVRHVQGCEGARARQRKEAAVSKLQARRSLARCERTASSS